MIKGQIRVKQKSDSNPTHQSVYWGFGAFLNHIYAAAREIHFHKTTFKSQNPNAIIKSCFQACYCAMFQLELNECWVILHKSISQDNTEMHSALKHPLIPFNSSPQMP